MSDDKDKKAPEGEEERTVFMPSGSDPAGAPAPPPPPAGEGNFFEMPDQPPAPKPAEPAEPATPPAEPAADEGQLSDPEPPPVAPEPDSPAAEIASDSAPAEPEAPAEAAAEPAPAEEARTVFIPPSEAVPPAPKPEPEPAPAEPAAAAPAPPAEPAVPPAPPAAGTASGTAGPTIVPVEGARNIKVGDVLNHIFEVKRFLARGGMGEVFEGCNVNTDERVAIKVMLPAMAANEKVVAMFRKEARTLTKLQHEALVSYRVLAQEPQLGVLYIVTEFIEGVELGERLGQVEHSPEELAGLLKRLASGLGYAHRLGAIHRDMSPDNVLLPGGDVHQAKIIDFGIAKDLDASSATIVGDGFAGKLNYVAPEQLGDFGREVGPWTDVYSLALVILAVAQGKNVNMSGSLVDAIDKRRKGPDLTPVPAKLRPLLEAMLRPDPKDRLRSMDEVLAKLGGEALPPAPPPPPSPEDLKAKEGKGSNKGLLVGGLLAAALVAGAGAWYALGGLDGGEDGNQIGPGNEVRPSGDPVADARNAINSVMPSVPCTWLDISGVEGGSDGVRVAMRGVAGDIGAAQRELNEALTGAGLRNARLDVGDVAQILPAGCAALDTYRQVRATSDLRLTVPQPRFEMMLQPPNMVYAGQQASNAVINFNFDDANLDFAILGIEPSGAISTIIPNRAAFDAAARQSVNGRPITDEGNGRYRLNVDLDHQGWSGVILVSGRSPFDEDVVAPPIGARGPSWQQRFLSAAAERNWRIEMVWFESVDRVPGDRARAVAAAPAVAPTPAPEPAQAGNEAGEGDKPQAG
jgi:serine/threonine-protein kinase